MSITTIEAPTHYQPESPEERDPMKQYYGLGAYSVAKQLFGEDLRTPGVMYARLGDVPHRMEFTGTAISDINMITGQLSGSEGLDGFVVSQAEAERLVHSVARDYNP